MAWHGWPLGTPDVVAPEHFTSGSAWTVTGVTAGNTSCIVPLQVGRVTFGPPAWQQSSAAQADADWQQFVDWQAQQALDAPVAEPEPVPLPTRRAMALDGHIPAGA